jgi:hypothetical protein
MCARTFICCREQQQENFHHRSNYPHNPPVLVSEAAYRRQVRKLHSLKQPINTN